MSTSKRREADSIFVSPQYMPEEKPSPWSTQEPVGCDRAVAHCPAPLFFHLHIQGHTVQVHHSISSLVKLRQ